MKLYTNTKLRLVILSKGSRGFLREHKNRFTGVLSSILGISLHVSGEVLLPDSVFSLCPHLGRELRSSVESLL